MIEYYKPIHFKAYELVDPKTYSIRKEKSFQLFNPIALWTIDAIRDYFDVSLIINDWKWKGKNVFGQYKGRKWSGLRTPNSKYYSKYSQHSLGNAFDIVSDEMTADEMRNEIKANSDAPAFSHITAIEEDVNWLHIDFRNWDRNTYGIFYFQNG